MVRHPVNDVQIDEPLQPVGEQVPGNAQVPVEAFEPSDTTEEISKDQECPAISNSRQGGGDGAFLGGCGVRHRRNVAVRCVLKPTCGTCTGLEGVDLGSQVG